MESKTGQQNMANDTSTAIAGTAAHQSIFIKSKNLNSDEDLTKTTKNKKPRGRKPKTSADGNQSDSSSQAGQSKETKKRQP